MTALLFVYGTLRDPDLLAGVLSRPLRGDRMLPAVAPGFRVVHYPERVYPALVRVPGERAEGLVLTDLTPFEHDLLDAFEGEEYRRSEIAAIIDEELHEAFAYLPAIAVPAEAVPWTLALWQARHKPAVLAGERASADKLRRKLIAIRPN
ncbi:MAG: gamma-glutamylcyclotransferase family protein [Devosia sp.]